MNSHIIFSFVALTFVQLVNGQTACLDAQNALTSDATCFSVFSAGTDISAICFGLCRTLFDNIINNCDSAVSCYRVS